MTVEAMQDDAWDRQMEKDFAPGGRGSHLLEKVDREIDAGDFTALEEGLLLRRKRRAQK